MQIMSTHSYTESLENKTFLIKVDIFQGTSQVFSLKTSHRQETRLDFTNQPYTSFKNKGLGRRLKMVA